MTIQERLEQKRAEVAALQTEQDNLWKTFRFAEDEMIRLHRNPWHACFKKLEQETANLAVLEAVAKEMQPA